MDFIKNGRFHHLIIGNCLLMALFISYFGSDITKYETILDDDNPFVDPKMLEKLGTYIC